MRLSDRERQWNCFIKRKLGTHVPSLACDMSAGGCHTFLLLPIIPERPVGLLDDIKIVLNNFDYYPNPSTISSDK